MFDDLSFFFSSIVVCIYVVDDNFIFLNTVFFGRFRERKLQNAIVNGSNTENIAECNWSRVEASHSITVVNL